MTLARCGADVAQLSPRHAVTPLHLQERSLPGRGRVVAWRGALALSVRPERWLVVEDRRAAGESAQQWQHSLGDAARVVDLSGAFSLFYLRGRGLGALLARGCRLDLESRQFAVGTAAATVIAQVSVTLAVLSQGILLFTPATTGQHLFEWLHGAGQPCGLRVAGDVTVATLSGDESR
jgi:heterotetrameric sarcosine oxidase gamma subunit